LKLNVKIFRDASFIKSGDVSSAYWFAKDIKGADIEKLREVVIKSGNAELIKQFEIELPRIL